MLWVQARKSSVESSQPSWFVVPRAVTIYDARQDGRDLMTLGDMSGLVLVLHTHHIRTQACWSSRQRRLGADAPDTRRDIAQRGTHG